MSFGSALFEAVSKPSLVGVVGIVALAALQFAAVALWLTPERIAASADGMWMENPWDQSAYATIEALRMQRADPTELGVVVVGSSATRHVFEDHRVFPERLAGELGESVRMHFLPVGGQTIWESELLLDHLPDGFQGAVVIGLHPGRAVYDEDALRDWLENPKLGLDSDTTDALRRRLGLPVRERTGFYFFDQIRFVSARRLSLVRNWLTGPPEYQRHGKDIEKPLSEYAQMLLDTGLEFRMRHWENDGQEGAAALKALVSKLTARGIEVFVMLSPLNETVETLHPDALARFQSMVRESTEAGGGRIVDLNARAQLEPPDFRDVFHLNDSGGRDRCEDVLADDLIPALADVRRRNPGTAQKEAT